MSDLEVEYCINCDRIVQEDGTNVVLTKDGHLACCRPCADAHYDAINMTKWCSKEYLRFN